MLRWIVYTYDTSFCGAIQDTFIIRFTGKSRPSHRKIETKMDGPTFSRCNDLHRAVEKSCARHVFRVRKMTKFTWIMLIAASFSMMLTACGKEEGNSTESTTNLSSGELGFLYSFMGRPSSDTARLYDHYTRQGFEIAYDDKEDQTFLEYNTETIRGKIDWSLDSPHQIIYRLDKTIHLNNWKNDFFSYKDSVMALLQEGKAFASTHQPVESYFDGRVSYETMDELIDAFRSATTDDLEDKEWGFVYKYSDFVVDCIIYKGSFGRVVKLGKL